MDQYAITFNEGEGNQDAAHLEGSVNLWLNRLAATAVD
jgi:hypothetical protein